ncbi:monocarboxylate transporter 13-like [Glandiceps talaboti]
MAASSSNPRQTPRSVAPPDGGFGWVVAFGGFFVYFLFGGQGSSFGVLYVEFLDAFGASKASTAWIGSIFFGVGILSHLLSMTLINRFGYRTVVMIGGFLSSVGLFATSFATSIEQVYFIYGVFVGLWFWTLSLPTLGSVGKYFTKRLPLAMGIILSGTGAGQFALSFTIHLLLDEYGWRGTLMILAALNLNICVAGALLRPIEVYNAMQRRQDQSVQRDLDYVTTNRNEDTKQQIVNKDISKNGSFTQNHEHYSEIISRDDQSPWQQPPPCQQSQVMADKEANNTQANDCQSSCKVRLTKLRQGFKNSFDWSLFSNLGFGLFIFTGFTVMGACIAIMAHIVSKGNDYGIPGLRCTSLPAILGLTQFLGRLFWGILGGVFTKIKPTVLYGGSIAVAGIATIVSIHTTTYTGQLAFVVVLGICMACFTPIMPVIIRQLLCPEKADNGLMFYLQAQGLGGLFVSPFVGWMRDVQGHYVGAFYILGAVFIVSAMCSFPIPIINKWDMKRKERKANSKMHTSDVYEEGVGKGTPLETNGI